MPGHRGGQSWPASVRRQLASLDTTELLATDDLHHPTGPAREAMLLAASCFGAGQTLFLTNGATGGILAMLAGLVGRGRKVILPRTCHLSILHAIALLDLEPVWLEFPAAACESSPLALLPDIPASAVAAAIAAAPDSSAIILTYPDYYGRCADLAAIAQLAHAAGLLLLVDEAHGAHLAAAPGLLPATALASGADACVQSAHKTLPALTQGAYLHLSADLLAQHNDAAARVSAALRIFQTSSPSFAIAASLDFARDYLEQQGHKRITTLLGEIGELASLLGDDWLVSPPHRTTGDGCLRDPARIVIRPVELAVPCPVLSEHLMEMGIDVEMADLTRLILIPALDQPHQDFVRLAQALRDVQKTRPAGRKILSVAGQPISGQPFAGQKELDLAGLEKEWLRLLLVPPQLAIAPGEVLFGSYPTTLVPLCQATGRIAATALSPYPPGIPLVLPGERIDRARLDLLERLRENKVTLAGVDHDHIRVVV